LKLLLDQNLSRRLLPDLEAEFPGSAQVQLLGLDTATDLDVDFLELTLLRGFPPKVVWLNCGNMSNAALRERLLSRASQIRTFLASADEGVLEIE
jgi:predicted nuclease of predicted toxin-antitoxin system